jgi:hypothetical protein
MRNGQNKRMRGRNRNKPHHGGHHHHNPLTRVYESNGPEVKIRGTAHHVAEKYLQLARDAQTSGDPVTAENHFQHAEHYYRLIAAAQEQFRQQNPFYQPPPAPGEGNQDDAFDDEGDDMGQPGQGQQMQVPTGFGNQQQPYPQREPQPFGGTQQGRQPQAQPQPQHNQQPVSVDSSDGERLPSFITGAQPQNPQGSAGFAMDQLHDYLSGGRQYPDRRLDPAHPHGGTLRLMKTSYPCTKCTAAL